VRLTIPSPSSSPSPSPIPIPVKEKVSRRRYQGGGIMEEAALGRHHGEASWRHHAGASGRRHHGEGIHLRFSPPVKVMLAGSDLYKHCQSPIGLKVNVFIFSFFFSWWRVGSSLQITRMRTLEASGNIWEHSGNTCGHVDSVWDNSQ